MPELIDQMYCSQQIVIPPKYPYILKRYCKAAIKTQPYDLLRWSFEYFKALAQHRPPPVKLRLEYPVFSTEGGLTRGCLKVLANQLSGMVEVPISVVKSAWAGFCLDQNELRRIFCLCEVYVRDDAVPFLHFIAVAGGLLTKSLTHTMILLCETLTKEPDGGSAAIPVKDFLTMYKFLAYMDASKDVRYINGYREGEEPLLDEAPEEEEELFSTSSCDDSSSDDYWQDKHDLQKLSLINDHVARTTRLSVKLTLPTIGKIERSPSIERAGQIERENYMRERKGRPQQSEEIDQKLRAMSTSKQLSLDVLPQEGFLPPEESVTPETHIMNLRLDEVEIFVYDEEENEMPYEFYGEPRASIVIEEDLDIVFDQVQPEEQEVQKEEEKEKEKEKDIDEALAIAEYVAQAYNARQERQEDLEQTFDEIAGLVDRYKSANYDLGMVAGRQMSTTSGEFIVHHIEKEIMAYIDEQIAVLPDPDLKKKKAKPEEVEMIRMMVEKFFDDNMEIIAPEVEEVEEEELPIPDITIVYAVPGIGAPVEEEIINEVEQFALEACKVQANLFMPRNIRHFMCPPLEKYVEHKYDILSPKEEVATGGVITD